MSSFGTYAIIIVHISFFFNSISIDIIVSFSYFFASYLSFTIMPTPYLFTRVWNNLQLLLNLLLTLFLPLCFRDFIYQLFFFPIHSSYVPCAQFYYFTLVLTSCFLPSFLVSYVLFRIITSFIIPSRFSSTIFRFLFRLYHFLCL